VDEEDGANCGLSNAEAWICLGGDEDSKRYLTCRAVLILIDALGVFQMFGWPLAYALVLS